MNRVRVTPHFLHRGAPRRRKIGGSFAGKFPQYCVKMLLTKPRWIGRTPRGGDVPISCNANSSKVLYPEFSSWKTQRPIAFICKGEREREREIGQTDRKPLKICRNHQQHWREQRTAGKLSERLSFCTLVPNAERSSASAFGKLK